MQKAKRGTSVSKLVQTHTSGVTPLQSPEERALARLQRRLEVEGPGRGRREIRPSISIDEMADAVMGNDRMELVVALAHGPRSVGDLQRWIGARYIQSVTEHLLYLQEFGIVKWIPDGTRHIYQLTNRVLAFPEDGNVQIVFNSAAGHWVMVNFDESGGSGRVILPPTRFIDPAKYILDRRSPVAQSFARYDEATSESHHLHHGKRYRNGDHTDVRK